MKLYAALQNIRNYLIAYATLVLLCRYAYQFKLVNMWMTERMERSGQIQQGFTLPDLGFDTQHKNAKLFGSAAILAINCILRHFFAQTYALFIYLFILFI